MKSTPVIIFGFLALLIACVLITGCTDNSATANPTPAATPSVTHTTTVAKTTVTKVPTTVITTSTTTSPTTVITTTTTVPSTAKPSIKSIVPEEGNAASNVSVTNLAGTNFISGATVKLRKTGNSDIVATNVVVQSATSITCTLPIPAGAQAGAWDLVVTNPDSQSDTYSNVFSVHGSTNPTTTTTTTTTTGSTGTVTVTVVDPPSAMTGEWHKPLTLVGTNFKEGIKIKLISTQSSALVIESALPCTLYSSTMMLCYVDITAETLTGLWDVKATNTDATTGTLSHGFQVR